MPHRLSRAKAYTPFRLKNRTKFLIPISSSILYFFPLVNCPVGYFFNTAGCHACSMDQYQDQEAQMSCISCPSGTSTFGKMASKWRENCEGEFKNHRLKRNKQENINMLLDGNLKDTNVSDKRHIKLWIQ